MFAENSLYEILTPDGWKDFRGVSLNGVREVFTIRLVTGESVTATENHHFFQNGEKVKLGLLSPGMMIDTVNGPAEIADITPSGETEVYDVIEVDGDHSFYVNTSFISHNCDEFAFVRPSIAQSFWASISPTLSTGGKAIITSTPNSDEDQFAEIWHGANDTIDAYGDQTECGKNGFKAFFAKWDAHPDRDEEWARVERSRMSEDRFLREHECEFVTTDDTLISNLTLKTLTSIDPIEKQGQVRWFKKPEKGKTYLVGLDPSLGTGSDPACIQVFQLQGMIQVAEWTHNLTVIHKQVAIMREIIRYIAEVLDDDSSVYYTVENNTIGEVALNAIEEIGEENIPGIFMSEPVKAGKARRFRKGFNTTNSKKLAACARLKQWVEGGKLKINSKGLVSELKNFVTNGASYAAKPGTHDDLIMATLLVVRLTDVIKNYDPEVAEELTDSLEDVIVPMPFFVL